MVLDIVDIVRQVARNLAYQHSGAKRELLLQLLPDLLAQIELAQLEAELLRRYGSLD